MGLPVALNFQDQVGSGGMLLSGTQQFVFANGLLVSTFGWQGAAHYPCPFPATHCKGAWSMIGGSLMTFIGGLPICRMGDSATCGDSVTGTPFLFSD